MVGKNANTYDDLGYDAILTIERMPAWMTTMEMYEMRLLYTL